MVHGCLLKYLKTRFIETPKTTVSHSLTIELEAINLDHLLNQTCCEKVFYFKSKNNNFTLLSVGNVKEFDSTDEVITFQQNHPNAFLCCPFKFEENKKIYLGEWTFISDDSGTRVIIYNDPVTNFFSPPELFFEPIEVASHDLPLQIWIQDELYPDYQAWCGMIHSAQELFAKTDLKKIVLSRKRVFEFERPLIGKNFFYHLLLSNQDTRQNYKIFYQENHSNSFLSLTPEILFSINKRKIKTVALAASSSRETTHKEDTKEELKLLNDPKLIDEHQIVVEDIQNKLKIFCTDVCLGELSIMKLSYIQHRSQEISADLKEDIHPLEILANLSPTPAIGGMPKELAIINIKEIEAGPREHYSAPMGVLNSNYTEFAVGIRAGKIDGNKITLFAGAGILPSSEPESEWNETARKMTPFLKVLNHGKAIN